MLWAGRNKCALSAHACVPYDGRRRNDEGRRRNDEGRRRNDEGRRRNDEATDGEQRLRVAMAAPGEITWGAHP
ncbi:MAG: hypothetical protein ACI9U2_000592 [Bradymonadia bacterium]|jgi:hypothetical protein